MSAFTERLATKNPLETHPATLECAVFLDGFRCVLGATWGKTAMLAQKRAQYQLISANDGEKNFFHGQ